MNKNELENIDKLFRDNQNQFDREPNPAAWDKLEQLIEPEQKKSSGFLRYGMVAALLLLFCIPVGLYFNQFGMNDNSMALENKNVQAEEPLQGGSLNKTSKSIALTDSQVNDKINQSLKSISAEKKKEQQQNNIEIEGNFDKKESIDLVLPKQKMDDVAIGDNVVYTIEVEKADATGVSVLDQLPSDYSYASEEENNPAPLFTPDPEIMEAVNEKLAGERSLADADQVSMNTSSEDDAEEKAEYEEEESIEISKDKVLAKASQKRTSKNKSMDAAPAPPVVQEPEAKDLADDETIETDQMDTESLDMGYSQSSGLKETSYANAVTSISLSNFDWMLGEWSLKSDQIETYLNWESLSPSLTRGIEFKIIDADTISLYSFFIEERGMEYILTRENISTGEIDHWRSVPFDQSTLKFEQQNIAPGNFLEINQKNKNLFDLKINDQKTHRYRRR